MRRSSLLSLLSAATMVACAGTPASPKSERTEDERAVLLAVQRFFDTMTAKDTAGARTVLDPEGDFVSVRWDDAGEPVVRRASNAAFLERLATLTETYLERMWESEVRVHGPIATVWTPYDFHVDGKFSHCGVDAFQLLRTPTGWTVTGGTYTVERTGCTESPLGVPGR
jgi:hypothetical protein